MGRSFLQTPGFLVWAAAVAICIGGVASERMSLFKHQEATLSGTASKSWRRQELLKWLNIHQLEDHQHNITLSDYGGFRVQEEMKDEELRVYSFDKNERKALCIHVKFLAKGKIFGIKRPSQIFVDWIGTTFPDKEDGIKCTLSFMVIGLYLKQLQTKNNAPDSPYDVLSGRDAAVTYCTGTTGEQEKVMLTPLSLLKYGKPFYTERFGLVPMPRPERPNENVIEIMCEVAGKAKMLGETNIDDVIKEIQVDAAMIIRLKRLKVSAVSDSYLGGLGTWTFADVLKRVGYMAQAGKMTKEMCDTMALISSLDPHEEWPCDDCNSGQVMSTIKEFASEYPLYKSDASNNWPC